MTTPTLQSIVDEMRQQAKLWSEVCPKGSTSRQAKVNFANWINAWADQLTALSESHARQMQELEARAEQWRSDWRVANAALADCQDQLTVLSASLKVQEKDQGATRVDGQR